MFYIDFEPISYCDYSIKFSSKLYFTNDVFLPVFSSVWVQILYSDITYLDRFYYLCMYVENDVTLSSYGWNQLQCLIDPDKGANSQGKLAVAHTE